MISYDDAEGMLQDQGLEVVVIPYRPSPPKPSFRPPRHPPDHDEQATSHQSRPPPTPATVSPASDESKMQFENDGESMSLFSSPPPPPPTTTSPPPPISTRAMFTPRTGSVVAEALNQRSVETTPPPHHQLQRKNLPNRGRSSSSCCAHGNVPMYCNTNTNRKSTSNAARMTEAIRSSRSRSSPVTSSYQRKCAASSSSNKLNNTSCSSSNNNNNNNNMGLYQMAKAGYQELCNAIIRPPRSTYTMESLGPEEFTFCGTTIIRKDFGVVNERGLLLECSMWKKKELVEEEEEEVQYDEEDKYDEYFSEGLEDMEEDSCDMYDCDDDDDDDDDTSNENNDINHKCGQITLNVDHWDESKERGQMFLHVPESFDIASSSSTLSFAYDDNENDDDVHSNAIVRKSASHGSGHIGDDEIHNNFHSETRPLTQTRQRRQRQHSDSHYRRRHPVVIYLHGNSSGRTEVISQLGHLLSLGVSVVAFDFSGSGMSEGDYVSLGYFEQDDLKTVIYHLKSSGEVSTIALWGRSMGAATAIMYGSRDPTISCMVLDSPFTDLTSLAEEMVERAKEHGLNIPNFVVSVALRMIKRSVKSQAGFSIRHISPMSHVNRCFIPAMFVAGEHDDFIDKKHSKCLHAKYAGDKNLVIVDGDHNSPRPRYLLQSACLFLQSCMQLTPSLELVVPLGTNLSAPPWVSNTMGSIARSLEASLSLAEKRTWLPVTGTVAEQQYQQSIPRQRSHPPFASTSSTSSSLPPGIPLDANDMRSRSCADGSYVTASPPTTPMLPLPDMSERQTNIQRSLFKML